MEKEKCRGRNFVQREAQLLLSVLAIYNDVINSKRTDAESIGLKNHAWTNVTTQFNRHTQDGMRSKIQFKHFWDNYKKRKRKLNRSLGLSLDEREICPVRYLKEDFGIDPINISEEYEDYNEGQFQNDKSQPQKIVENNEKSEQQKIILPQTMDYDQQNDEYEKKRMELVNLEVEKLKDEIDQQKMLFSLNEIKAKLEIEYLNMKIREATECRNCKKK